LSYISGGYMYKRLFVLGALLATIIFILACGDNGTPTATRGPGQTPQQTTTATATPQTTPTSTTTAQPVASKLIIALSLPPSQSTMPHMAGFAGTGPLKPMYEPLIGNNPTDNTWTTDQLASKWSMAPNGKDWTFELVKGVPFHRTGVELTAKDVVHTWKTIIARGPVVTGAGVYGKLQNPDTDVEIKDPHNFTVHLSQPEVSLRMWVSDLLQFRVISKDYWDQVGEEGYLANPVGSGPFEFVSYEANRGISYRRVENHWRKTAEIKELDLLFIEENATRMAMLLSKEAHVSVVPRTLLPEVREKGYKEIRSTQPGSYLFVAFGGQYYGFAPNEAETEKAKFDPNNPQVDPKVRKAMSLAVNRDELNQTFFGGEGVPHVAHGLYRTDPPFNAAKWVPDTYDPERARQLLAEAGHPNGFDLTLIYDRAVSDPPVADIAEVLAGYWSAVGIRIKLEPLENAEIQRRGRARELVNTLYLTANANISYELAIPYNLYPGRGSQHWFDHPTVMDLVLKFENTSDPAERDKIAREIGDFLYDQTAMVTLFWSIPVVAADPKVVEEYVANHSTGGPTARLEYMKLVKK
jgi:peptide/nickel transport system substrate-binding protein